MALGIGEARKIRSAVERDVFSDAARAQSAEVRPTPESHRASSLFEVRATSARRAAHEQGGVEVTPPDRRSQSTTESGAYPAKPITAWGLLLASLGAVMVGGPLLYVNPVLLGAADERFGTSFRSSVVQKVVIGAVIAGLVLLAVPTFTLPAALVVVGGFAVLNALGWGLSRLLRKFQKKNSQ